jgi:CheY-like chemotaxis protein
MLSHELRTPLTPVLAVAQAMEEDPSLPEEMRTFLEIIRRNVELEVILIDDLLDLVRVSKGKLQLELKEVNVHTTVENVVEICRSDIEARGLKLKLELQATGTAVMGDPARLQQVLWNLLKNAVKFSPDGGEITLRTTDTADGKIAIEVADHGAGIEPELLPLIFNAFEQGSSRRHGGLGLGLAITHALVEAHGGSVSASSAGPGRGAEFLVELVQVPSLSAAGDTPKRKPEGERNHGPIRILLVEDHLDTKNVMTSMLQRQGHTVLSASTMESALDLGLNHEFDLLVSDIGLPDGSGLDLMRELSTRREIKGIALSGYGREGDRQRSEEAGFREHLVKPVNSRRLTEAILRAIES